MQYRRFGKTNLWLSVFSLGTMRYLDNDANAVETVQRAVALGINHIETAKGYGKSEEYLGTAISSGLALPRSQLYITTKIPPTADAETIHRYIDESLGRLKLDYLDCLAIHGLNTWEHLDWVKGGYIQAVRRAVADGRVRHVGFSSHGTLELIWEAINTDLFEFVNLHYYYFFQRHELAVELAHQKIWACSSSHLRIRRTPFSPPSTLKELCHPLSPLELNYRFLLSDRRITTLSLGAANPDELTEPLTVADKDYPLTPIELQILERLQTHQAEVLGTDKCSQCYACLPCPENINIPEVLRLRNLSIAYDMTEYGQYRYRMFENAGHWFPGVKANRCTSCGDCLPRCPENLKIPDLLEDTHSRLNGPNRRRLWE